MTSLPTMFFAQDQGRVIRQLRNTWADAAGPGPPGGVRRGGRAVVGRPRPHVSVSPAEVRGRARHRVLEGEECDSHRTAATSASGRTSRASTSGRRATTSRPSGETRSASTSISRSSRKRTRISTNSTSSRVTPPSFDGRFTNCVERFTSFKPPALPVVAE